MAAMSAAPQQMWNDVDASQWVFKDPKVINPRTQQSQARRALRAAPARQLER